MKVSVKDLNLGDTVDLGFQPWGSATVYRINPDGSRQVWRPYVHTGSTQYSGPSVIPYLGMEDFALHSGEV
jgi:hypothetical protein